MVTKHYKIFGRVQGVGFRRATVDISKKFPVTGTVANVHNYVELFVSGEDEAVDAFMKKVLNGPNLFAKITSHHYDIIDYHDYQQFKQV